jgi:hypothetical protein
MGATKIMEYLAPLMQRTEKQKEKKKEKKNQIRREERGRQKKERERKKKKLQGVAQCLRHALYDDGLARLIVWRGKSFFGGVCLRFRTRGPERKVKKCGVEVAPGAEKEKWGSFGCESEV